MENGTLGRKVYKGFINLLICMIVFIIIAGIGTIAKFGSRIPEIRTQLKVMEQEYKQKSPDKLKRELRDNKMYTDGSYSAELKAIFNFTESDYIFIAAVILIGWIIVGIYWIYTLICVMVAAKQVGANVYIFGILTLFTNLLGAFCLWIYIKLHSICPKCGKLQQRKALYCAECGSAMYMKCPVCNTTHSMKARYCTGCGRSFDNNNSN